MNLSSLQHLNPKWICDIGANTAEWAKEAQSVWPDASIHCIEGCRECEPALKESGFPYTIALLGDSVREVDFFKATYSPTATGNSYLREQTEWFENPIVEKRTLDTLDNLFQDSMTFDFVKIDCQGAELDIIRGGLEMCKRADAILMEVAVSDYNQGAPKMPEVIAFMVELGFVHFQIVDDIVHPKTRELIQHDILFTK